MDVAVSSTIIITIGGTEFILSAQEAETLYQGLYQALGKSNNNLWYSPDVRGPFVYPRDITCTPNIIYQPCTNNPEVFTTYCSSTTSPISVRASSTPLPTNEHRDLP